MQTVGVGLGVDGFSQFQSEMAKANQVVRDFARQSSGEVEDFSSTAAKAGPKVDVFREVAVGALRAVGETAVMVLGQATRAMADFVGDSSKVAGDFEANMYRFEAVTGSSIAEGGQTLDEFRELFMQLGADTQFSAAEAQEAAIELAKGGVKPLAISSGVLEQTLSLAAAGELDLANAAEITAKAMAIWGDTGVTAADVANRMAQAANASTVDVAELALGMYNAQGVARNIGVTFDDFTTTLAALVPAFGSASDAGTSLKVFMMRLNPTTKSAADGLRRLGLYGMNTTKALQLVVDEGLEPVDTSLEDWEETLRARMIELGRLRGEVHGKAGSDTEAASYTNWAMSMGLLSSAFYDATGNFIGMQAATDKLNTALSTLSSRERQSVMQGIFGQDAISAASVLARIGEQGFTDMRDAMDEVGTAADQAAIRNRGFNFAVETLGGSVETLKISIGSMLNPTLTALINEVLIPATNAITEFSEAMRTSGDPVAFLLDKFASLGTILRDGFVNSMDWLGQNLPGIIDTASNALVGWIDGLSDDMTGGAGGIGEVVGQIAKYFTDWWDKYGPDIQQTFWHAVDEIGKVLTNESPKVWNVLSGWGKAFTDFVLKNYPTWAANFGKTVVKIQAFVLREMPKWAQALQNWASEFALWILPAAGDLIVNLGHAVGDILVEIVRQGPALGKAIQENWWPMFVNLFDNVLPEVIVAIGIFLGKIWKEMSRLASNATAPGSVGEALVNGIQSGIAYGWNAFTTWVSEQFTNLINTIKRTLGIASPSTIMIQAGRDLLQGLMNGINAMLIALLTLGGSVASQLLGRFRGVFGDPITGAQAIGYSLVDTMTNAIGAAILGTNGTKLRTTAQNMLRAVQETFTHPILGATPVGARLTLALASGALAAFPSMGKTPLIDMARAAVATVNGEVQSSNGMPQAAKNAVNSFAVWFGQTTSATQEGAFQLASGVIRDFSTQVNRLTPTAGVATVNSIAGGIETAAGNQNDALSRGAQAIVNQFIDALEAGGDVAGHSMTDSTVNAIQSPLSNNAISSIRNAAWGITTEISSVFTGARPGTTAAGQSTAENLITSIATGMSTALSNQSVVQPIKDRAKNIIQLIENEMQAPIERLAPDGSTYMSNKSRKIGEDVMQGIKDGFETRWNQNSNWWASWSQEFIYNLREVLGISSPSRVAFDMVGVPVAQGVGAGLMSGLDRMKGALQGSLTGFVSGILGGNTMVSTAASAQQIMLAGMQGGGSTYNTTNQYMLNVQSRQSAGSIARDFGQLQALAGAI